MCPLLVVPFRARDQCARGRSNGSGETLAVSLPIPPIWLDALVEIIGAFGEELVGGAARTIHVANGRRRQGCWEP